jgi:hypothetical protein
MYSLTLRFVNHSSARLYFRVDGDAFVKRTGRSCTGSPAPDGPSASECAPGCLMPEEPFAGGDCSDGLFQPTGQEFELTLFTTTLPAPETHAVRVRVALEVQTDGADTCWR